MKKSWRQYWKTLLNNKEIVPKLRVLPATDQVMLRPWLEYFPYRERRFLWPTWSSHNHFATHISTPQNSSGLIPTAQISSPPHSIGGRIFQAADQTTRFNAYWYDGSVVARCTNVCYTSSKKLHVALWSRSKEINKVKTLYPDASTKPHREEMLVSNLSN